MNYYEATLLSLIEGITEFLPISSTGHMIIVSSLLGIEENQFVQNFEVIIQFGAILSVVFLYYKTFLTGLNFYKRLLAAFIPTGILGFSLKGLFERLLGSVEAVAWALIIGGILLLWLDRFIEKKEQRSKNSEPDKLPYKTCVQIGFWQSLALIPGVSRSGASIAGGVLLGLSRVDAATFSFFLAVPTLTAAALYKLLKIWPTIHSQEIGLLLYGSALSFFVAVFAMKAFVGLIKKFGFKYFGVYRVIIGTLILVRVYFK